MILISQPDHASPFGESLSLSLSQSICVHLDYICRQKNMKEFMPGSDEVRGT